MKSFLVLLIVLSIQNVAFGDWIRADPSWVTGANGQYLLQKPQNLMDGKLDFGGLLADQGWNALQWNVVNWVTVDFKTARKITKFGYNAVGDTTHDPKEFDLQIQNEGDSTWTTVATFTGASGTSQRQEFGDFSATASKWRWNIRTRYTGYQAYATEIYFYEDTCITTNRWLINDPSWVVGESGHYADCVAQNLMDGKLDFDAQSNGWNANDWYITNYADFDFGKVWTITGFAYNAVGDTTHDPKEFDLQIQNEQDLTWTTVATFTGASGTSQRQEFGDFKATARKWRWNIRTRYTGYQAYATEVQFQIEETGCWLKDHPSWVTGANSQYLLQKPQNVMDGKLDFNALLGEGWNALQWNVPNWITFDFETERTITKIAYYCVGDTTHDVKEFDLQIQNGQDWTTVATYTGASGTSQRQEFGDFTATASNWRWNIRTRYSGYQAYVTEVEFFAIVDPVVSQIQEEVSQDASHQSEETGVNALSQEVSQDASQSQATADGISVPMGVFIGVAVVCGLIVFLAILIVIAFVVVIKKNNDTKTLSLL